MICKHVTLCSAGWLLPGGQVLPAVDAWFSREGAPAKGQGRHGEAAGRSSKPTVWGTFVVRSQSYLSGRRSMKCMDRHRHDYNTAEL